MTLDPTQLLLIVVVSLGGWNLVQTVLIGRAVAVIQATMNAEAKADDSRGVEVARRIENAETKLSLIETRLNECQKKACCLNPPDPAKPPHLL